MTTGRKSMQVHDVTVETIIRCKCGHSVRIIGNKENAENEKQIWLK